MPARSPALDLPPPFRLLRLREVGDAFAHASAHAGELGAGSLVFVGRFDLAEFAVVLEPEEPLVEARRCFYAGMNALADALAALAPPETPIAIEWPDAIAVDQGLVGGGRLAWPQYAVENAVPDWLVFGAMIRLVWMRNETGSHPQATALAEEGFGIIDAARFAEAFARHLMVGIDRWQEGEFGLIAQDCTARLPLKRGVRYTIDAGGDLRIEQPGNPAERRELRSALAAPSWLDPVTGTPRLSLGPAATA